MLTLNALFKEVNNRYPDQRITLRTRSTDLVGTPGLAGRIECIA